MTAGGMRAMHCHHCHAGTRPMSKIICDSVEDAWLSASRKTPALALSSQLYAMGWTAAALFTFAHLLGNISSILVFVTPKWSLMKRAGISPPEQSA
jgi:hypothetical protein